MPLTRCLIIWVHERQDGHQTEKRRAAPAEWVERMVKENELSEAQIRLKKKVVNTGRGLTFEQATGRADKVVKMMSDEFAELSGDELAQMQEVVARMKDGEANHGELAKKLFAVCHEMRATAGTFGFQVASIAASKLCALLENNPDLFSTGNPMAVSAAKVHLDAIGLVLHGGPSSKIGPAEARMLDGLSAVAKKLQPANA